MARRSVLLLVALLIAFVGTALIVIYVMGINQRATAGQDLVEVMTTTETIHPGETIAEAHEADKLVSREVRRADVLDGALSSPDAVMDRVALSPIFPGEQIIADKIGSAGDAESLVIPDDKLAVSVELTDPERVAGFVNPGSDVAIFLSADPIAFLPDGSQKTLATVTRMLLPKVQVIGVGTTTVTATTTTTDAGQEVVEQVPRTILTVAVDQDEAERLIFASRNGDVSFALLSAKSKVSPGAGITARDVTPQSFQGLQ